MVIGELERVEIPDRLARHLARELGLTFGTLRGPSTLEQQVDLCNEIVAFLRSRSGGDGLEGAEVAPPPRLRQAIHHDLTPPRRPATRLAHGALLTASADDPRLGAEILAELVSAEAVDAIVSFVKTRGWQKLREGLEAFSRRGGRFRLLSSTYLGASDAEAFQDSGLSLLHRRPTLDYVSARRGRRGDSREYPAPSRRRSPGIPRSPELLARLAEDV